MVLRYFFLMIVLICNVKPGISQSKRFIDSLENRMDIIKNDSLKVEILNELAFQLTLSDTKRAREYAQKALIISENFNFHKGRADCLVRLGTIAMMENKYFQAEKLLKKALAERKQIGVTYDIMSVYNLLGSLAFHQNDYMMAIEHYRKALSLDKSGLNSSLIADVYNNLSNCYRILGAYKEAISSINKGIEIKKEIGDEIGSAKLLMTLGNWYFELENYKEAKDKYELTIEAFRKNNDGKRVAKAYVNIGNCLFRLGKLNDALVYLDDSVEEMQYLDEESIANLNRTKGNIYRSKNLIDKAIEAFEKSLSGFVQIEDDAEIASLYYNIGLLKKDDSNLKQAIQLFLKCESILDTLEDPLLELSLCQEVSQTYLNLGQIDQAFIYSLRHNDLQDSLDGNYREAMNYKLNYEEEKRKNEQLENEIKVNQLIVQKKAVEMRSFIGLGTGLFILSIIVFLYRNNKRKSKQQLKNKNQEIDNLLRDQEVKTTYAKLEGQDEERKRIAQEHDRVGSILSTIKLYFDGFNTKLDSIQSQNLENHNKANTLLDEAVSEVRKIAQNIHSGTLTKFGLKAELEALAELLRESKKIDIQIATYGLEERLPMAYEIKIYRIIQELISNILKHAKASKITIQLNQFKEVINFIVQDNGIGFDLKRVEEKNGMGLKSIRSRIYNLHGSIIIDTGKGNGTTVTVDIPREE